MTRGARSRPDKGYTLIDLLVVMAGVVPALFVSRYFSEGWRTPIYFCLSLSFGIGFWCATFLWLLPVLKRRRDR